MGTSVQSVGNNFFFIDINTTTRCNLRCKYCIEPFKEDKDLNNEVIDKFISRMDEFFESKLMQNYDGVTIGFWGGEPTTNPKAMQKIIKHYEDNDRIRFLVYSNGYRINHMRPFIEEYKNMKAGNGSPKVYYQISYDGRAAHAKNRLSYTGKETTEEVRDSIAWAMREGIPFSVKSTINRETFDVMDECYEDIVDLVGHHSGTYFPTIDYLTNISVTDEERVQYYKAMEKSLINIAQKEIEYYKKNKRFFFSWFSSGKALCAAGAHGLAMDLDGTIYKCHGVFYSDKKIENKVTSIYDDTFMADIEASCKMHKEISHVLPEACKNCYSEFCLKCNSMSYDISEKDSFMEKWNDYPNQPEICEMYRLATQVKWGMQKVLGLKK